MAIDHHRPEDESYELYAKKNQCLVNLKQIGYEGKSKLMPASVLSAILFDYILKKQGMKKGLVTYDANIPLDTFLDAAILGDWLSSKQKAKMLLKIIDLDTAKIINFISNCGTNALYFLSIAESLNQVKKKYNTGHGMPCPYMAHNFIR